MLTEVHSLPTWRKIRREIEASASIGFVPTMGCLHLGHLSLIKKSIAENDVTVVSIFINPTQFNDPKDYARYPKHFSADIELLRSLAVDYVLLPQVEEMYPEGNQLSLVTEHPLAKVLEGACRPGHFNGVLTVVMKLLQLVMPMRLYLGEKDYQQYFLIKNMVENYFLPIEVIACPTMREESGLPFSSRNTLLSVEERCLAEQVSRLFHGGRKFTLDEMREQLDLLGVPIEYLESFQDRIFVAVKIGPIRLIDNWQV